MKGLLFNIQKFSLHDGPGIRSVVFFKGCPLQCRWCSNPESQLSCIQLSFDLEKCRSCQTCVQGCENNALRFQNQRIVHDLQACNHCQTCVLHCPAKAISTYGEEYSLDAVMKEVLKDKAFYEKSGGGVTLSGGEVFLQPAFAKALCQKLVSEKINIAIESSLVVSTSLFETLLDYVDSWLVDLKHYDEDQLIWGTGLGFGDYFKNLKKLQTQHKTLVLRIPVIPGFNDSVPDARKFVALLNELGISKVELLPFHHYGERKYELLNMPYRMRGFPGLVNEDLKDFSEVFEQNNIKTQIGG